MVQRARVLGSRAVYSVAWDRSEFVLTDVRRCSVPVAVKPDPTSRQKQGDVRVLIIRIRRALRYIRL